MCVFQTYRPPNSLYICTQPCLGAAGRARISPWRGRSVAGYALAQAGFSAEAARCQGADGLGHLRGAGQVVQAGEGEDDAALRADRAPARAGGSAAGRGRFPLLSCQRLSFGIVVWVS